MGLMIVRLRVRDYFDWQKSFDECRGSHQAAGLTNERVYRSTRDGNDIVLVMDAADLEMAKRFAASAERRTRIARGDVIGAPRDHFLGFDHAAGH